MMACHAAMPEDLRSAVVEKVLARTWNPPIGLGAAVGIAMQVVIRHRCTPYDALLKSGLPRDEARRLVATELDRLARQWTTHKRRRKRAAVV